MNRAVLVVLVDFLMISLVTLFNSNQGLLQAPKPETAGGTGVEVQAVQDMLEVLQQALSQEQMARGQMSNQLSRAEQQLQARQEDLAARDQMIQQAQQNVREAEARAKEIAAERARLQQAQSATQEQLAQVQSQQSAAQAALQKVQQELQTATAEASSSRTATEAIQTELAARRAEVTKLQDQLARLQDTALTAQAEKGRLATNLTRVETEAALFRTQLEEKREQIASLSQEKERIQEHATTLAKGMDSLAQESQNLATQIQEDRQLAPNTIYRTYLDNRVACSFRATRSGLFGIRTGDTKDSQVVLFRDGGKVYVLFHIQETTLPVWSGGGDWDEMTAVLARAGATVPLTGLSLVSSDPRIVVCTLDEPTATQLGVKPFEVSEDPAKFQDAVIVGGKEGYYGEVEFKLVPGMPRYLRMQRRTIGKIFGKFSPSKGDLAFSKSGELLGMMVNSQYCALVRSMPPSRFIPLGKDIAAQRTGLIGGEISRRLQALPPSLQ